MIKSHKTVTTVIYLSAATALSTLMLSRNSENTGTWSQEMLIWLISCAVPLLFIFAYATHVFSVSNSEKHRQHMALLHVFGLLTTITLFPVLALPFRQNPIRDNDSIALGVGLLAVLCLFLVAALFLLIRKKSSLAMFSSVLIWPYWLMFALMEVGRYFQGSTSEAIFYFLCFITPVFLAFAAGVVAYRPPLSHTVALFAVVSAPWLYLNLMRGSELANVWIIFNVPDNKFNVDIPYAVLGILCIGLITAATAMSILRLLPLNWHFRGSLVRDRTWPAFAASFAVLTIWFGQSVMPYRIPGAVDYSSWPMLQILHVEKRGLQFHESCVSVTGRASQPRSITFSSNNRRLFEYQFEEKQESGTLPDPLVKQISEMIESTAHARTTSDIVKPIRAWNADAWYFYLEGSGQKPTLALKDQLPRRRSLTSFTI